MKKALCQGYFSCVHYGHLELFMFARSLGDQLTVAVARTSPLKKSQIPVDLRASLIKQLRGVYEVIECDDGPQAIRLVRPDYYVKGPTWENDTPDSERERERIACNEFGARIVVMKDWKKWTNASKELETS